jgi:hypothetical protein
MAEVQSGMRARCAAKKLVSRGEFQYKESHRS